MYCIKVSHVTTYNVKLFPVTCYYMGAQFFIVETQVVLTVRCFINETGQNILLLYHITREVADQLKITVIQCAIC